MLIDTHAHLYAEEFRDDLSEVVDRARKAGVTKILLPNIESSTAEAMWNVVKMDPVLFSPMIGLHPCSVKPESIEQELEFVKNELITGKYLAVGEIGMDLYWDKTTKQLQESAFITQCEWAASFGLPVAIHSRESTGELIRIIRKMDLNGLTGVFHCFSGTEKEAQEIIELGFMLGIGGVLTFKNSNLREIIKDIPLEHLILETDSPYLSPAPYRGKRNESSYTAIVAEALAQAKDVTVDEIGSITSSNAARLFRLNELPL